MEGQFEFEARRERATWVIDYGKGRT
jgi:hypothetical protein